MSVSGYNIRIPDNLLVDFPAAQVPFAEFVAGDRAGPNEVSVSQIIMFHSVNKGTKSYRLPETLLEKQSLRARWPCPNSAYRPRMEL